jgi:5-deoxy-glucuronate isomerase
MNWVFRKGDLSRGNWDVNLNPTEGLVAGWKYTGLNVANLSNLDSLTIAPDSSERLVIPLDGGEISVTFNSLEENGSYKLRNRKSVFHGATDVLYLPINCEISLSGTGRVAIAQAPAKNVKPVKFVDRDSFPQVIRGAGPESRQIHDFGGVDFLDADRFIVVEVIVPAGNWSGIPPHKHDTYIPNKESNLEEIYYFELAPERNSISPGIHEAKGFFNGYSADRRPYEVMTEVKSGDVVLVPNGWHGPVGAFPGYDMYFLNVMAGPDPERAWNITDDPSQVWIRETWKEKPTDPRLPYLA